MDTGFADPASKGLGQANATRLNLAFLVCSYLTPVFGAALADQYWGRYKTIVAASLMYMAGLCVLTLSSAAFRNDQHLALMALILAMIFIAVGTGGIKPSTGPWAAEQYQKQETPKLKILRNGERVLVDYGLTVQR